MADEEKTAPHPLEQFMLPERVERLDRVLAGRTSGITVVLDRICNYHNISAVLRSADAFGIKEVQLVGGTFEYSRGISLGTERWMQLRSHNSADEALAYLHSEGFKTVVLQPETHSRGEQAPIPVTDLPFDEKLALVFGNEGEGVSPAFIEAADIEAFIPMLGFVESLNISVACAICLFCSMLSGAKLERRVPALSEEEGSELRELWLKQSVRSADEILKEFDARRARGPKVDS